MATIQIETVVTIAVDRSVRDVLRNCLRSEAFQLEHCDDAIRGADADAAHDALARAVHLVQMFDQLGWADDDPRDRYEITVGLDSFVAWLRGHRDDLRSLAEEVTSLHCVAAGDEAHDWGAHTQPEMIAKTRDDVVGWRRELDAIDGLLERLDTAGGVE